MELVIDVQGFPLHDGFLIKELALSDGKRINHFVFKPKIPYRQLCCNDRRLVTRLETNHHALRYSDGYVNLCALPDILQRFAGNAAVVYVKGHQKVNVLKNYLEVSLVNLEYVANVPKLSQTNTNTCMYHLNDFKNCAISNVTVLCDFLNLK